MDMRFVGRLIVLGFAGFGLYRTWQIFGPKVMDARQRAAGARDRIEPAIRDAAEALQTATRDAADELADTSRNINEVAPDAFGIAVESRPDAEIGEVAGSGR
jgi:hypothetical protein